MSRYTITNTRILARDIQGKNVARIAVNGYVIEAEALQRDDGWMPSATIHEDRAGDDVDSVTDDYRVIAPEDVRFPTRQEALDHAEALARTWVSQKG